MTIILELILMSIWMGLCFLCICTGIMLGLKRQKEHTTEQISAEEKRKREKAEREFQNFLTYNGDEQSR